MSCREYESIITDLTRAVQMEERTRESALLHTASCAPCAALLANERALTAGLQAVAQNMETIEAPVRVEAALRARFREEVREQSIVERWPARRVFAAYSFRSLGRSLAAVAAVVVIAMLTLPVITDHFHRSPEHHRSDASPSPSAPVPENRLASTGITKPSEVDDPQEEIKSPVTVANRRRRGERFNHAVLSTKQNGRTLRESPGVSVTDGARDEIVTEFFPLTQQGDRLAGDGGQFVRVEVPRAALASFGLPVNMERTGERIKADVLLGHDGVAHAIRFVR